MSAGVGVGATVAAASSVLYNAGFLIEKKALDSVPPIHARRVGHMVRTLLTSPLWLLGCVIAIAGLLVQVLALSLAPLSVVQPIQVAGIIVLVVVSHVVLGERLGAAEKVAVAMLIVGLGAMVASLANGGGGTGTSVGQWKLLAVAVPVSGLGVVCALAGSRFGSAGRVAGFGAGLLYGVASLGMKDMSVVVRGHGVLDSVGRMIPTAGPWLLALATLAGLVAFQAALQRQPASLVVPLSNVTSSAFVVALGAVLFHETLPPGAWAGAIRIAGFVVLLLGIVLTTGALNPSSRSAVGHASAPVAGKPNPHDGQAGGDVGEGLGDGQIGDTAVGEA